MMKAVTLNNGLDIVTKAAGGVPLTIVAHIALPQLTRKPWIVPLPGTTQMAHMLENIGADSVPLLPSEVTELTAQLSAIKIQGLRLPEAVLQFFWRRGVTQVLKQQSSIHPI
jgi:hypothetical protein